MKQGWYASLIEAQGNGPALSNSLIATSILPPAAKLTYPAGFFSKIGDKLRVMAAGRVSNIVTTPGTLTLDLRLGSTIIATSGAIALNTTAKTNVAWMLWWELTLQAIGQSANFMPQGAWMSESVVGAPAGAALIGMMPASAPAVGNNFDATAIQVLDFFATFSIANAGNAIQLHQYEPTSIN